MKSDSHSDILSSLFGSDVGTFLGRCDRRHPDLADGELSEFLNASDEIVRAAELCLSARLKKPFDLIASACPKSFGRLPAMIRALSEPHRSEARLEKSSASMDLGSICEEVRRLGSDLPESFCRFGSDGEMPNSCSERWSAVAERFRSIGCDSFAEASLALSSECKPDDRGYHRLGIRRAAMILCKRRSASSDSRSSVFVSPVMPSLLPAEARDLVLKSDAAREGFPFFDHHILVSFSRPEDSARDFVVLGDRDGECYFLCSD